jgi:hypothetical protein
MMTLSILESQRDLVVIKGNGYSRIVEIKHQRGDFFGPPG